MPDLAFVLLDFLPNKRSDSAKHSNIAFELLNGVVQVSSFGFESPLLFLVYADFFCLVCTKLLELNNLWD